MVDDADQYGHQRRETPQRRDPRPVPKPEPDSTLQAALEGDQRLTFTLDRLAKMDADNKLNADLDLWKLVTSDPDRITVRDGKVINRRTPN
jgi:ribosome assembly protein YihI (activator of Der GTPase)